MPTDDHPNVAIVRRGLDDAARGDIDAELELWDDEAAYFAFDDSADAPAEVRGRTEIQDMMLVGHKIMQHHWYDIVDVRPVGDELVVAHLRVHSSAAKSPETAIGDYLGVYRIKDGRVEMACDFIDRDVRQFLDDAWS
jgi:ketosteroid isomerase-like protein